MITSGDPTRREVQNRFYSRRFPSPETGKSRFRNQTCQHHIGTAAGDHDINVKEGKPLFRAHIAPDICYCWQKKGPDLFSRSVSNGQDWEIYAR